VNYHEKLIIKSLHSKKCWVVSTQMLG